MLRAILFAVTIAIVAGIGFYFGRSSARVSASDPQPVRTWVSTRCRRPDAIASGATGVTAPSSSCAGHKSRGSVPAQHCERAACWRLRSAR